MDTSRTGGPSVVVRPGFLLRSLRTHCYYLHGQTLVVEGRTYRAAGVSPNGYVSIQSEVPGVRAFLAPDDYVVIGEGPLPSPEAV